MTVVALSEVIRAVTSRAGVDSTARVYSVTKHGGFVPSDEYFSKQVFSKDLSTYKVVERGQFAYATIHLDEGSLGYAPETCLVSPMYTVFEVDQSRADNDYLFRLLKSPNLLQTYSTIGRGSAERRRSISLEALGAVKIPLPLLPEQRRIASILDGVENERKKRIEILGSLDSLHRSVFENFLADESPGSRPLSFGEIIEESQNGLYKPADSYGAAGVPIVRIADFAGGNPIDERGLQRVMVTPEELEKFRLFDGDLLVNRVNSMSHIGKSALAQNLDGATMFESNMMRVRLDRNAAEPMFVLAWLSSQIAVNQMRRAAKQAINQASINQTDLAALRMSLPPIERQRSYVKTRGLIDRVRDKNEEHLASIDELFASLQHRAFRGEL